MDMNQFDFYLVNLDPTVGSEIKKTRPAVIVSPVSINRNVNTVIVAPWTHGVKGYPSRVVSNFQNQTGEIVLDQIQSVDKRRLTRKLGNIDPQTASDIKKSCRRCSAKKIEKVNTLSLIDIMSTKWK
jgi:mRNA interferase MazF